MEQRANGRLAPSIDAIQMANAIKRIMSSDIGELAERLDAVLGMPMLEADSSAMFFTLVGEEPGQLLERLDIDPAQHRKERVS